MRLNPRKANVRLVATGLLLSLLLVGLGCRVDRPKIPNVISSASVAYTLDELKEHRAKYEAAMDSNNLEMAKRWRDTMIGSIRRDIDSYYHLYEVQLASGRRNWSTFGDITSLAGVAAATITNGERAKTVISALVSFAVGSQTKIDKNIYQEKTIDVIVQNMRASRLRMDTLILDKMSKLNAAQYNFNEAETDVRELFWAGTLQSGFLEMARAAGNDVTDAKAEQDLKVSAEARIEIPDINSSLLLLTSKIQQKREELEATWVLNKGTDKGKQAVDEAREILAKLKSPAPAEATPEAVFRLLRKAIVEELRDPSKITQIANAMGIK